MAISKFLALNTNNGTPQLRNYTNSTPTLTGVTFGSADTNADTTVICNKSSAIVFGGYQTFLAVTGGVIYRSTDGAASWTSVRTIGVAAANQGAHTGLRVTSSGGSAMVFILYTDGSGNYTCDHSLDGVTWSSTSPLSTGHSTTTGGDGIFWNGKFYGLFALPASLNEVVGFDPATTILSTNANLPNAGAGITGKLCVFNGNLYCVNALNPTVDIWQLITNWTKVIPAIHTPGAPPNDTLQEEFFAQGGFMWLIYYGGGAWHCDKISSSLTVTSSDTSIPGSFNTNTGRIVAIADSAGSTGSEPALYIYYSADSLASTTWSAWQWNGTSVMTLLDVGGSAADTLGAVKFSGGSTFWQTGIDGIKILSRVGVSSGIRYSFLLYSASGTDTVSIRGWQGSNTQSYPFAIATLSNPSVGVLSSNTVTSLTADNSTTYQVTWSSSTDGFSVGSEYSFILEQF